MKRVIIAICFSVTASTLFAKSDSVKAVFGRPKYSWLQVDLAIPVYEENWIKFSGLGESVSAVFNERFAFGIGFEGGSLNYDQLPLFDPRNKITSLGFNFFNFEYLFKPRKLFNLSFPLKIGRYLFVMNDNNPMGAGTDGTYYGEAYYIHSLKYFSLVPGMNANLNLFHSLSIGGGIDYRFCFGQTQGYSGPDNDMLTISGIVRVKMDWKWMMEKQKEKIRKIKES